MASGSGFNFDFDFDGLLSVSFKYFWLNCHSLDVLAI